MPKPVPTHSPPNVPTHSPTHFLSLEDWPAEALRGILERAAEMKRAEHEGRPRERPLAGLTAALYFERPSLRTHVTFEAGLVQLGAHPIFLTGAQVGVGTREAPADVARALSRWVDLVVARMASHEMLEALARAASVPVVNGLTDLHHPCQTMADLLTVSERVDLEKARIAFVGDGNNVATSLLLAAARLGLDLRLATPEGFQPPRSARAAAERLAAESGARIRILADPAEAVRGAQFVYTDVWASMGQEEEAERRRRAFRPYQVNEALLEHAPEAWVMHDLPAHRGEEITDAVMDGPRSIVFDQAENRLHAQKAVVEHLLA